MRQAVAPVCVAMLLLAGCSGSGGGGGAGADLRAELAGLQWGPLIMRPTPGEPFEKPGDSILAWSGDLFGARSADPGSGLRVMNIVAAGYSYTSNQGLGWYKEPFPGDLSRGSRDSTLVLWDLRSLVQQPAFQVSVTRSGTQDNFTLVGSPTVGGRTFTLSLQITVRDHRVTAARLDGRDIPETPFIYRAGGQLPFPLEVPSHTMSTAEILPLEARSALGHGQVVNLVINYTRNHAGLVPQHVDPDTLRLELLASGKPWPTNPFDGQPMHDERKSGHFEWCYKGGNVGSYSSYGWDNLLGYRGFGGNC